MPSRVSSTLVMRQVSEDSLFSGLQCDQSGFWVYGKGLSCSWVYNRAQNGLLFD